MSDNKEILQKIYAHPKMRKIPVSRYSTVANIVIGILEDMQKESHHMAKATMSLNGEESKEGETV